MSREPTEAGISILKVMNEYKWYTFAEIQQATAMEDEALNKELGDLASLRLIEDVANGEYRNTSNGLLYTMPDPADA